MCGITGIVAFNDNGCYFLDKIAVATACLSNRGPDASGIFNDKRVALGHRRLSIIDTSDAGAQPMSDSTGRYTIIFNGEFFNFRDHRNELIKSGVFFNSESDTEVLLYLFMREGAACLEKVNGFFSLAIYDHDDETVFIARDRFGVKPFYYFVDDDKFIFASEMKAILKFGIPKQIDKTSLYNYLQLNYIPAPATILRQVQKLEPASWMLISYRGISYTKSGKYYRINKNNTIHTVYSKAKRMLEDALEKAVERRLVADVPLGSFLSGGIDSSIIAALASRHVTRLNTFSIGFKDKSLFDETYFAKMVAEKLKTEHTVFSLSNDDLFNHLFEILDYTDEPFADSSAIAVFILSMETRKHVTVALSGDGADELFAGYNKHRAEWLIRNNKSFTYGMKFLAPLLFPFEGSRNSKWGNKIRQVKRFAEGTRMKNKDRYWRWCAYADEQDVDNLLMNVNQNDRAEYVNQKRNKTGFIKNGADMNDTLLADVNMVLPDDMLTKVDRMSMANSLEVRTPFLDFEVVDLAFSFPSEYKIDASMQKKILKDAFREILPAELYTRTKQGFEVPLLTWFRTGLKSLITDDLLENKFILEQQVFNPEEIKLLKKKLFSVNPGEIHARIWGLIVFQYWYKKYFINSD